MAHRERRYCGTTCSSSALPWLLDVAPFPSRRRSRLLMRHSRSASATIRHPRRASNQPTNQAYSGGCQPPGVGRLNVSAACVERATTMRTGSVLAGVHLDVHQVRRHPHEVAGVRVLADVQLVARVEACVARDDVNAAFGFAMVVHRRDQPWARAPRSPARSSARRPCSGRWPPRAAWRRWPGRDTDRPRALLAACRSLLPLTSSA